MSISTTDFVTPYDPTGYPSVNGAQLLQLVAGLLTYTGVGLNIVTTDSAPNVPQVPPANVTTKWQNYIWIRITATAAIPYIWNPAATPDATYLQWVSLAASAIGAGTITGSNIAGNTITDYNIASLSYSKLIGAPIGLPPSGTAGGILSGTYPNPTLVASSVLSSMIAAATILGSNIALNTITYSNVALATLQGDSAGVGTGNIAANTIVGGNLKPGTAGQTLQTNAGATAVSMVSPMGLPASGVPFGRVLQIATNSLGTNVTAVGQLANTTSAPAANATGVTDSTLSLAFTPISATSTLLIEIVAQIYSTNASNTSFLGLYNVAIGSGATAPLAVTGVRHAVGVSQVATLLWSDSGAGGARTYRVGFGSAGSSATCILNSDGSGILFGSTKTWIKVTEYI